MKKYYILEHDSGAVVFESNLERRTSKKWYELNYDDRGNKRYEKFDLYENFGFGRYVEIDGNYLHNYCKWRYCM